MEELNNTLPIDPHRNKAHITLAHSYMVYFVFFLLGVMLDFIFKFKIVNDTVMMPIGLVIIVFATALIFWAQKTSRNLNIENLSKETFLKGPYAITRMPTSFGLFFLVLGFAFVANATFVVVTTVISFLLSKFIFLEKQESILEKKYSTHYAEYKKQVKF
jgi:protein-S-isoprenylcysteine O-methyltransferase Ste14